MEVFGKSMVAVPSNVIYLSSILGQDGPNPVHKCDWKCENENVCGNIYRCRLTGLTHICDKNCNQRIVYDNHSSLCRVSRQVFPLTPAEEQAVRGVRRKLDAESSPSDSCAFKRIRDAQLHPSAFERSFVAVGPICSQIGDGMDMREGRTFDCSGEQWALIDCRNAIAAGQSVLDFLTKCASSSTDVFSRGTPQLLTTGFELSSSQSVSIPTIPGWSGRIWARTGCNFNELGVGTCQTGDCGGRLECNGMGAIPPASLFEITLGTGIEKDYYDVSIVDGYNLPLVAAPQGVYGECNTTGCVADINMGCPKELQVVGEDGGGEEGSGGGGSGRVVACKSACNAFGLDQYCCSGEFANPSTCRPSFYSTIFKRACPRAYSYAFDDGTSTFTCKAYDYSIIFCPHDLNNHHGTNRPNDTIPAPPIYQEQQSPPIYQEQQQGHGEIADMVSSSKVLLPISSISIILIVLFLNLFF